MTAFNCQQRSEEEPRLSRSCLVRVGAQKHFLSLSHTHTRSLSLSLLLSPVASYEFHTIAYPFSISIRTSRVSNKKTHAL